MHTGLPAKFNHLTTGKDGTKIYTVPASTWKEYIDDIHRNIGIEEWYMKPGFKWVYEHTKLGYYPRGIAMEGSKEIYIQKGSETDYSLLAHEYGHILGYGHTGDARPDIMNAVDPLRLSDPRKITDRFEYNFPDYYNKVLVPAERNRAIPAAVAVGLILFGAFGG
jgi:hypothetical protein